MAPDIAVRTDRQYISTITVCDRYHRQIVAGTAFIEAEMIAHSFQRLKDQGYLKDYRPGMDFQPEGASNLRRLSSIPGNTPAAALNPPEISEQKLREIVKQKTLQNKEITFEKVEIESKKVDIVSKKAENRLIEEKQAQEILAKNEAEQGTFIASEHKDGPAKVWNLDPAKCEDMSDSMLASIYRDKCAKYNIPVEEIDVRENLIRKLTSEFISK